MAFLLETAPLSGYPASHGIHIGVKRPNQANFLNTLKNKPTPQGTSRDFRTGCGNEIASLHLQPPKRKWLMVVKTPVILRKKKIQACLTYGVPVFHKKNYPGLFINGIQIARRVSRTL